MAALTPRALFLLFVLSSFLLFNSPHSLRVCSVAKSCPTLWDPLDCSPPGFCVHGCSRQEYWSGLPCPPPGDLLASGMEPGSPSLQADSLPSEPPRKPYRFLFHEHPSLWSPTFPSLLQCWISSLQRRTHPAVSAEVGLGLFAAGSQRRVPPLRLAGLPLMASKTCSSVPLATFHTASFFFCFGLWHLRVSPFLKRKYF